MRILILFIPLTTAFVLPFDSKKIDYSNNCLLGSGAFGTVCSAKINGMQIAVKNQELDFVSVNDLSVILYSTSKSPKQVIPTIFVTITEKSVIFGLPKMVSHLGIIFGREPKDALEKDVWNKTGEHTLIDIVKGISELNKIGIKHNDIQFSNIMLNTEGRAYIIDFSASEFIKPLTEDFYNQRNSDDDIYNEIYETKLIIKDSLSILKRRKIDFKNNWQEILKEFSKSEREAKTTARIAKLIEEGAYKLPGKN